MTYQLPGVAVARWQQWSCDMELWVTDPDQLDHARTIADAVLWSVAAASNRFDATSELSLLSAMAVSGDIEAEISPMLEILLRESLDARQRTCGLVDPTVGSSLTFWGYDRDITSVRERTSVVHLPNRPAGRGEFQLDGSRLTLARGTALDLGVTAKAQAADLAAHRIAAETDCGVLVNLGGDIAVAGQSPAGGWRVSVEEGIDQPGETIAVYCEQGDHVGIATSSTVHRRWKVLVDGSSTESREITAQHIIDPRTGRPVRPELRTATVVADSAAHANAWSTALIILGARARGVENIFNLPVRTVDHAGHVTRSGWWPEPQIMRKAA